MESYTSFVIVAVIAFLAPLIRAMAPQILVPAIVLELVGGIIVGPHGIEIASSTPPVEVFSTVGLACLLFLAGREIQVDKLRGPLLTTSVAGFAISFVLAFGTASVFHAVGLVKTPLLVAIVFVATSLSIIIVPLKDARETDTEWGQQVIAAAAVAEFGAVILLSFFYSGERSGPGTEIFHLSLFVVLAGLILFSLTRGSQFKRITDAMQRLEGTSAQIGVRGDFALIAVVAGVASQLGLETILAAFTVGVIRGMTSGKDERREERREERLDAVTLGIFIPFFFVDSGLHFDIGALFQSVSSFIRLPLFVLAVLIVRALPALIYRSRFATRRTAAAGLLQATSLSFIVVATQIGLMLNIMYPATATALVGAGLITVMVFPALAFSLLGETETQAIAEVPTR
ncbi:MAG: cation:proton antiporter [Actinobacteria bacterium]|nr:MAG: cation:proton antiporter [Actinomycetota bacterium]